MTTPGGFESALIVTVTAEATHPEGTVLDADGNPVLDADGNAVNSEVADDGGIGDRHS